MELLHETIARFREHYRGDPDVVVVAPGRVNLIGEHTDYNDGYVLPVAIDRCIVLAAGTRPDQQLSLHAIDLQGEAHVPLEMPQSGSSASCSRYAAGVAHVLQRNGHKLQGANFTFRGNIPIGSGLSSSAALEVACTIAFDCLNTLGLSPRDVARISREAEVDFVGVNCGIMDQFTSVMGLKGHALFLDCRSLQYRQIAFPGGVSLVICDTGIRRELAQSSYNLRKEECQEALLHISRSLPQVRSLRDLTEDEFRELDGSLSPIARKRLRHVVTENRRVLDTVVALERGDFETVGKMMVQSHISLRDDYEVSCSELDAVVESSLSRSGVYGARMTGAGFGGCAICLVKEEMAEALVEDLRSEYSSRIDKATAIYLTSPADGASVILPKKSYSGHRFAQ